MAALSLWGGLEQAPSADPGEQSTPTEAARRPRRRLVRRVAGVGVVAATVAFAVVHAKATMAAARLLGGVRLDWLGLALGAEAASLLSFCLLRLRS